MKKDENIKNSDELEFAVFCIENVTARLGVLSWFFLRNFKTGLGSFSP